MTRRMEFGLWLMMVILAGSVLVLGAVTDSVILLAVSLLIGLGAAAFAGWAATR